MKLAGKVFVVTGGSQGIGRATAEAAARAGAKVVVSSRREQACDAAALAITKAGGEAAGFAADVTDPDAMTALAHFAVERFGKLDLSFLNAGHILPPAPIDEISLERFDAMIDVNLRGVFYGLRAQMPFLSRAGGAVVINSAGSGLRGRPGLADYCASKWGVIGLAMAAAHEGGPKGVRVNVVAPGYIGTEAWIGMLGPMAEELSRRVPLRKIGQPDNVADAVVWLLSDEARYITGTVVPVDGGLLAT
jgi:NAD(P)-dependent dehydrogenase (short-subunit alcohol dehydrogenase family)